MNSFLGSGNWIDLIIILVLVYFASEAWRHGLWVILAEFLGFLGSLLISLRGYKFASKIITDNFNLSNSIANALGFLLTAIIIEVLLGYLFSLVLTKIPEKIRRARFSRALALIPALGQGIILISFLLVLLMGMPIRGDIKEDIGKSKIGGYLIEKTTTAEKYINEIFGGIVNDSLTYLTIKPDSSETLSLRVNTQNLTIDLPSETAMFNFVNEERKERGIKELEWSSSIVVVARDHARDMWTRKYFSHFSPEGEDVGDRLQKKNINYFFAGENLALAPTLSLAHSGLMNSEGHKVNILEKRFKKIGIGVIDNSYYGKIFVQIFTD